MISPLKSFAFLLIASATLPAAVVFNDHGGATAGETAYDSLISATDLVNYNRSTLTNLNSSTVPDWGTMGINDGSTDPTPYDDNGLSVYYNSSLPATITFTLNTSVNTLGYDITGINSIAGWRDVNFGAQAFELYFQTTTSGGFVQYGGTFSNISGFDSSTNLTSLSSMSSLTDSSGVIESGVIAVRLVYYTPAVDDVPGTLIREIDVFGTATQPIPEPSMAMLLISAGATIVLVFRKRRQTVA